VTYIAPRLVETPTPVLPAGLAASDTPVRLQALVDLDGRMQRAVYVSGPAHLTGAALDAVQRWRSEPPRINGAPVAGAVLVQVAFKQ
jgi:outer membrane biosynthesis protein TonB